MAVQKKLVVVGDGSCGKTCLLVTYATGMFPDVYVPTIFETYVAKVPIGNRLIQLGLWDTAGQEVYDTLRPLSYSDSDVVLMVYSIDSPASLANIMCKWISEVEHYCSRVPRILVGTKKDLRYNGDRILELAKKNRRMVTYHEGYDVAERINAKVYIECSAKTRDNVKEVFEWAAKVTLPKRKGFWGSVRCCTIV